MIWKLVIIIGSEERQLAHCVEDDDTTTRTVLNTTELMQKLRDFLLTEDKISLKVIFDNIRNYAIVGGLIAYASWSFGKLSDSSNMHPALDDTFVRVMIAVPLLILVALLLLLNIAQSALILHSAIGTRLAFNGDTHSKNEAAPSPLAMILLMVLGPVFFFAFLALFVIIPWYILNGIFFAISHSS